MMNSPMFIPILAEPSPRPQGTRPGHYQPMTQPSALNFTFNVNVNGGDYRPTTNLISQP